MERRQPSATRVRRTARWSAALFALLVAATATARLVVPGEGASADANPVLGRLTAAIEAGDHESMAGLIHPDGVRLSLGPLPERISELTSAQAFYYFKTLFQSRRTVRFACHKRPTTDEDRLLASAIWRFERTDTGATVRQRLLITLTRSDDGWYVTEITALRGS